MTILVENLFNMLTHSSVGRERTLPYVHGCPTHTACQKVDVVSGLPGDSQAPSPSDESDTDSSRLVGETEGQTEGQKEGKRDRTTDRK